MGRKKKKRSPEERAEWEAHAREQIRTLRELEAKIRAELEGRRHAEGSA
jgi:hypothetical protein